MDLNSLSQKAANYLEELCVNLPTRRVGSPGNQAASRFIAETLQYLGWIVDRKTFECQGWDHQGAELVYPKGRLDVFPSPQTLGGSFQAPLIPVSTLPGLDRSPIDGKILLLHGEIAREPLMPKNFPFYYPEEHQRIYNLVEALNPLAILTATGRSPDMAGARYPCPMFEDGNFDIPSVYLTDKDGERLARHAGEEVFLNIRASRSPSTGENVIALKPGNPDRRIVFTAHMDTKEGTPGALDNASGCAVLLLLAERLKDYTGDLSLEIAVLNGEEYYAVPGEQLYLKDNAGRFDSILLAVNLDGLGYRKGNTAFSSYGCPPQMESLVREVFGAFSGLTEGDQWYQGDHAIFTMNGRPAIALTSEKMSEVMTRIVHAEKDTPDQVDPEKLVEASQALEALVRSL